MMIVCNFFFTFNGNETTEKICNTSDKALFSVHTLNPPSRSKYQCIIITDKNTEENIDKYYNYLALKNDIP
jgi:hypothetical protein